MGLFLAVRTAVIAMVLNYSAHVSSSYIHTKICLPQEFWDIPLSLVTTASPACTLLLNTMQITQNNYANVVTSSLAIILSSSLSIRQKI